MYKKLARMRSGAKNVRSSSCRRTSPPRALNIDPHPSPSSANLSHRCGALAVQPLSAATVAATRFLPRAQTKISFHEKGKCAQPDDFSAERSLPIGSDCACASEISMHARHGQRRLPLRRPFLPLPRRHSVRADSRGNFRWRSGKQAGCAHTRDEWCELVQVPRRYPAVRRAAIGLIECTPFLHRSTAVGQEPDGIGEITRSWRRFAGPARLTQQVNGSPCVTVLNSHVSTATPTFPY